MRAQVVEAVAELVRPTLVQVAENHDHDHEHHHGDDEGGEEEEDDDDDVVSRATSPADLITIGCPSDMPLKLHHKLSSPAPAVGAPPSEADTDTESTLHSEFDHDHVDHDQMTEVGCCDDSDNCRHHELQSRHDDDDDDMVDFEPSGEPEEPDEPHEPDLARSATSDESPTPTEAPPSPSPASTAEKGDAPAPTTLTDLKGLMGSTTVSDEDMTVRMKEAMGRGKRQQMKMPSPSDRVLAPGKLVSPPTSPVRKVSNASSSGASAWDQVSW